MTRPHYQQIADAIYAQRRAEYDPRAVLEWEAEHGTKASRDKAIKAMISEENNDLGDTVNGWIFWPVVALLMAGFWGPWIVGVERIFNLLVTP